MSIIFSCNYLKELEELILENKVDVDFIKYPSLKVDANAFSSALNLRPVLFHGLIKGYNNICKNDFIKEVDIEAIKDILKVTGSTYLSDHISASTEQFPEFSMDDVDACYNTLLNNAIENIKYIKSKFDIPFVAENTVYAPHEIDRIKAITEPKFISELIEKTDSYFLFDTSHARQSAYYRGMSFDDYINGLPLEKTYEVHLSGTTMQGNHMKASHTKMNEEDYELLEYLLKNTNLRVVTLEYGPMDSAKYEESNPIFKQELYEQIIRIREIIRKY